MPTREYSFPSDTREGKFINTVLLLYSLEAVNSNQPSARFLNNVYTNIPPRDFGLH